MIDRAKRWLILTQYYPPEIGAPQIRLHLVAKELRKHDIEVEVLTAMPNYPIGKIFSGYSGRLLMREQIDSISVRRTWIYAGTGRSACIRLANYFSFTFSALLSALLGARPDVMFVESQPLSLGFVAVLMKWLRGVPYIYNVPDLQIEMAKEIGFIHSSILLSLAWHLENFFLRQAWKISTVTHHFIEHLQSRGLPRERISFLPNGADTDFLRPLPPSQELLDQWRLHGKKVFLYAGTFAYYHGLDILIEGAYLLRDYLEIVFLMIGDGPERARLEKMATELKLNNIIFGKATYNKIDSIYSITYTSIATLRKINVAKGMRPSKIFSSLSCGVPVIYVGFGEMADLIETNKCGMVVAPEEPAQLAKAVVELASDRSLRDKMGQAGRKLVEKEYGWPNIVKQWLNEIGYSSK